MRESRKRKGKESTAKRTENAKKECMDSASHSTSSGSCEKSDALMEFLAFVFENGVADVVDSREQSAGRKM